MDSLNTIKKDIHRICADLAIRHDKISKKAYDFTYVAMRLNSTYGLLKLLPYIFRLIKHNEDKTVYTCYLILTSKYSRLKYTYNRRYYESRIA